MVNLEMGKGEEADTNIVYSCMRFSKTLENIFKHLDEFLFDFVNLTQITFIQEEGTSIEKAFSLDWHLSKSVRHFLD